MAVKAASRSPAEATEAQSLQDGTELGIMGAVINESSSYPEGGYKAWMVVLGAWCAMVPPMGLLNTIAVLQAWVSENQLAGVAESKIAWIFSCFAFFITACGAQVGPIFDAHDIRVLTLPGSIGIVASTIFLSFSQEFYQFLLSFGVCGGISASLLFNPSLSVIGHWFCERRALATGLACTAGGLGGVAFPLIVLYLAPSIGFPWAIRVIACLSAGLLIAANILLRKRIPRTRKMKISIDFGLFRNLNFAMTVVAVFFVESAIFIPYSYICSYALYYGFSAQRAYLLSVFVNASAIPGRVFPGYLADRYGAFNTMCATSFACAVLVLGLWLSADGGESKVIAFTLLFGFWSGAAISLSPVCISRVCKIEDYGKCNGMAYFIASFGALVGIPIAGALLDTGSNKYQNLIIFGGGSYTIAFLAFCVARGIAGGWKIAVF